MAVVRKRFGDLWADCLELVEKQPTSPRREDLALGLFFNRLPDGFGQLVGAGSAFEAAADTFQFGNDILGFHTFHEGSDTLSIAVATAVELHILDDAILNFKLNRLTASALGSVSVFHIQNSRFKIVRSLSLSKGRI